MKGPYRSVLVTLKERSGLNKMEEEIQHRVVLATKQLHKGQLFGSISNGNQCLTLSDGLALRITALNDKFVEVQVLHFGNGSKPKNQSWVKTKAIKPAVTKPVQKSIVVEKVVEQKDLFDLE